jgi:5-hydroxyisourate hydrolase
MSAVTTHVLDTARGAPAAGIPVALERLSDGSQAGDQLASGVTDSDGRVGALGPDDLAEGRYRLRFDTASYFAETGQTGFFPEVAVVFEIAGGQRYHVPLLLSPYSYSTYRGS